MSPTARTLQYLRTNGITCQVVEKWNPFAHVRQDLFGCIDIVGIDGLSIIGIQCTSYSNHSARKKKIQFSPEMELWKKSGGIIQLISWRKIKNRWTPKVENL